MLTRTDGQRKLLLVLLFTSLALLGSFLLVSISASAGVQAAAPPPSLSKSLPLSSTSSSAISTPNPCSPAWQIVASPLVTTTLNQLTSVTAVGQDDMWAAGFYDQIGTGAGRTVTEHWNGTVWSLIPSPNTSLRTNALWSISSVSSNDVWAVGLQQDTNAAYQPLAEHWDGTWSVIPVPGNITATSGELLGVDAISQNNVWAVGRYNDTTGLIEHWDGGQWNFVPGADLGSTTSFLFSVSGTSANDVWAAGQYFNSANGQYQALTEHWNGEEWTQVSGPDGVFGAVLYSVHALAPDDVWAVGTAYPGLLVEHWDGNQWSVIPTDFTNGELHSVYARTSADVWMSGYTSPWSNSHALILHWDGTALSQAQNPDVSNTNELDGIVAVASDNVWAVGYSLRAGSNERQQMIQHYTSPCSTATPTATATPSPTATSAPLLVGHVVWQGPPAQPSSRQQLPVTITLQSGNGYVDYPTQNTDASGFFTVSVGTLPSGTYQWMVKGPRYLANCGSAILSGAPITRAEMGLMRTGDANNSNTVNTADFAIVKSGFGGTAELRADFNDDGVVNTNDFTLLKANFGLVGCSP